MENKLTLPFICTIIIAFAYCAAFHNERDKNQVLKEKIVKIEKYKK
jgi:hypothetical protein